MCIDKEGMCFKLVISSINKYRLLTEDEKSVLATQDKEPRCLVEDDAYTRSSSENSVYVPIMDSFSFFKVNIYVHNVRSSSGKGLNQSAVMYTVTDKLNSVYKGTGISFTMVGSDNIDSDAMNLITVENSDILFGRNPHDNAIDIYVLSGGSNFKYAGVASDIGGKSIIIRGDYYTDASTLAHEMGHAFGLYHTHHGSSKHPEYDDAGMGVSEYVNGSNSTIAGDYVSDTPADPCLWWSGGNFGVDENGDPYKPDPFNIMSYNVFNVRSNITAGQLSRINYTLMTNSKLLRTRVRLNPYTISGSKWINTKEKYSVNFTDEYIVSWDVIRKQYSDKNNYTSEQLNYSGNEIEVTNPNTVGGSQNYTLKAIGKSNRGFSFAVSKQAYFLNVSPNTSTLRYSVQNLSGTTTDNGEISIGNPSSKVINVKQGGSIRFYFTDVCGVGYSDVDMSLWMNGFTKVANDNCLFKCSSNAPLGIQNSPLNILWSSKSKVLPLKINVIAN